MIHGPKTSEVGECTYHKFDNTRLTEGWTSLEEEEEVNRSLYNSHGEDNLFQSISPLQTIFNFDTGI